MPMRQALAASGRGGGRVGRRWQNPGLGKIVWTAGQAKERLARHLLTLYGMKTTPKIRQSWFASEIKFGAGILLLLAVIILLPMLLAAAPLDTSTPSEFEDIAALTALAAAQAAREFPPLSEHQRFQIGPIDPHTELAKCHAPVRAVLTSAHHMQDRATLELRCPDFKAWHTYVQVRILGTSTVAVAVHAIVAGTVLKASDLKVETHDVSELPLGFLDDPAVAVGLTASRPIAGGVYITNQLLLASKAVQRGQSVTLLADAGGMSIRMAGRALTDGLINQRVKVTNLSSGRVVEGIARSEQVVEIVLQ
jgi:flagellar basal body P-ring formation protein FlgA